MDILLYRSTQFDDVKIILDREHGFAGLMTPGGIEASMLSVPFISDKKVLSDYKSAAAEIRRILAPALGLELPKGFVIPLDADDMAVFFSQKCGMRQMNEYLSAKKRQTKLDIACWLQERPWDTNPVSSGDAAAMNLLFDPKTGCIGTDGRFNPGTVLSLPSSIDGIRVSRIASYSMVSYTYLETISMPDSITEIEPFAFYDKVHLRRANISRNVKIIPEGMFARCRALTQISIPDGVEKICDEAFYLCSNLSSVYIPNSVSSIGRCAFLNVPRICYHGPAKGFPWGATVGI